MPVVFMCVCVYKSLGREVFFLLLPCSDSPLRKWAVHKESSLPVLRSANAHELGVEMNALYNFVHCAEKATVWDAAHDPHCRSDEAGEKMQD